MKNKALYKLSHFIKKGEDKKISFHFRTGNDQQHESMKRALFLANVNYEEYKIKENVLIISFDSLQSIKYIIPIINNKRKEEGLKYNFFDIDKKCKEFFDD